MNKTEMLKALEATVPTLAGKLHIERVLYKKEANKAYMSFLADVEYPACKGYLISHAQLVLLQGNKKATNQNWFAASDPGELFIFK